MFQFGWVLKTYDLMKFLFSAQPVPTQSLLPLGKYFPFSGAVYELHLIKI